MPSLPSDVPTIADEGAGRCLLFELPPELQLIIYDFMIPENELYLVNFPCNSSYRNRLELMERDEKAWKSGANRPPMQPAITRTCRFIRDQTLSMFYRRNVFRARYCDLFNEQPLAEVVPWLRAIGPENREMLRHLYFYDRNKTQDENYSKTLDKLKGCEIFTEMEGTIETVSNSDHCAHRVTFGKHAGKAPDVSLVQRLGKTGLRMEDET